MNIEAFIEQLKKHHIAISQLQLDQFQRYFELLIEWNQKMNLTAITQKEEVYLKHFFDSVMVLWQQPFPSEAVSLVDVGAGAGFPSIPIKILRPDLQVTIIDSLNKRITFLEHVAQELNLDHIQAIHARAEDAGRDPSLRGKFDIATARAVAPLNVLVELCLPLVKKGGVFIALKAAKTETEIQEAQKAIKELGARLDSIQSASLPIEKSERTFIKIHKTLETPKKYPRKAGKPSKEPII